MSGPRPLSAQEIAAIQAMTGPRPMPSHATQQPVPSHTRPAPSPLRKAETIGSVWQGGDLGTLLAALVSKNYQTPESAYPQFLTPLPEAGPDDEFLRRVTSVPQLVSELGGDPVNPDLPGPAQAAQAVLKMTVPAKVRMYAAGQLAKGRSPRIIAYELAKQFPEVKPEKLQAQIEQGLADLQRITQDSGYKATDLRHYERLIKQGLWNQDWYSEAIPMVKEVLPAGPRERVVDAAHGLTARQERALHVLAAFGTNSPPKLNFENFQRVVPYLKTARSDKELLEQYPWGLTSTTLESGAEASVPGLQSLRNFLSGEGFGGRKIESYDIDLRQATRPGYRNEPIEPLVADRHQFRAVGLPTEEYQRDAAGNVLRDPETHRPLTVPQSTKRSTARQSVYLGTSGLANSAYEVQEQMVQEAARQLGITIPQAQAAMWTIKNANDFALGKAPQQGLPFLQQLRLQQAGATAPPAQDLRDLAKRVAQSIRENGGASESQQVGPLWGKPVTAVSPYPERTRPLPPNDPQLEARVLSFLEDNQDLLQQPGVAVGADRYSRKTAPTPFMLGDREVPSGTAVLDVILHPQNPPPGNTPSIPARLSGLLSNQYGVYNLAPGVEDAARLSATYGSGRPTWKLPPIYERGRLGEDAAIPDLVRALQDLGPRLSPRQRQLLNDLIAQTQATGAGGLP